MKQSIALKEERASAITELEGIVNAAQAESREFTETEEARQAELNDTIFALDDKIEAAEKTEQILARNLAGAASKSEEVEMAEHAKEYSFRDAVNMAINGRLEGREREMHEEARNEFQAAGVTPMGNLFIPMGLTHRDVGTSVASGVVGTTQQGLLQGLVPESVIEQAGGNRITGVAGSVKLPSLPTDATKNLTEIAEHSGADQIASKTIDAKRIASRIDISNQTLAMANGTFDSVVAAQFRRHAGGIMDANAWATWSALTATKRSTAAGTTVKDIDFASANDLIAALGNADALNNSAVFFGNHATLATARSQQAVTNGGIPTLQADGTIAGYKAYGHSQIDADLLTDTDYDTQGDIYNNGTAGTTVTDPENAIPFFLVNMNDVYCCYWGGADLIVDNMSQAHLGTTRMIMNYYANCDVAHNASVKFVVAA